MRAEQQQRRAAAAAAVRAARQGLPGGVLGVTAATGVGTLFFQSPSFVFRSDVRLWCEANSSTTSFEAFWTEAPYSGGCNMADQLLLYGIAATAGCIVIGLQNSWHHFFMSSCSNSGRMEPLRFRHSSSNLSVQRSLCIALREQQDLG